MLTVLIRIASRIFPEDIHKNLLPWAMKRTQKRVRILPMVNDPSVFESLRFYCICLSFHLVLGAWCGSDWISSWLHLFTLISQANASNGTKRKVKQPASCTSTRWSHSQTGPISFNIITTNRAKHEKIANSPRLHKERTSSGPEVIKVFSCSTQLSMEFVLLINLKLLIISYFFLDKHSWAWTVLC